MGGSRPADGGIRDRHDGSGQRDTGDGVEVGEMREEEMDATEDDGEVAEPHRLVGADHVVDFLEGSAAGDHVDYVDADFHDELLWDHYPEPEFRPECLLAELVVTVEPLAGDGFVHDHH